MSRFIVTKLPLPGLALVERLRKADSRGFLERIFCSKELVDAGWTSNVAQINLTHTSRAGVVRGMHIQSPPYAEDKLVTCIRGEAWDVAVDLRFGSPTFLCWHGEYLSPENGHALLIPKGFAHGFQTLTTDVEMLYCHSDYYYPKAEFGLRPTDSRLNIEWPLPITEISIRDTEHPLIPIDYEGVAL